MPTDQPDAADAEAEIARETIPDGDPFVTIDAWLAEAKRTEPNDANAMALATATPEGRPSLRMVLLKGHGPDGFLFYTNADSRKGREIAANPEAALLIHWKSLRRQIRVEGTLAQVDGETADAYFASRSRDSQLGAVASDQSQPLASRSEFADRYPRRRGTFRRWAGRTPVAVDWFPACAARD